MRDIHSSEITPEHLYLSRRRFLKGAAAGSDIAGWREPAASKRLSRAGWSVASSTAPTQPPHAF